MMGCALISCIILIILYYSWPKLHITLDRDRILFSLHESLAWRYRAELSKWNWRGLTSLPLEISILYIYWASCTTFKTAI